MWIKGRLITSPQTRSGSLPPLKGSFALYVEQVSQKILPQYLQWCYCDWI